MQALQNIKEISFPIRAAADASLSVYENRKDVPFDIARVFVITAELGCKRGFHAHYKCQQLLVSLKGTVDLTIDDGKTRTDYRLDSPGKGVLIPAGLWAEQRYDEGSILMVLADRPYEEDDYIRDYKDFIVFAAGK